MCEPEAAAPCRTTREPARLTLETTATDARGARRDRRPAVSGDGALTRAEYRRLAAEAAEKAAAAAAAADKAAADAVAAEEALAAEQAAAESAAAAAVAAMVQVEAATRTRAANRPRRNTSEPGPIADVALADVMDAAPQPDPTPASLAERVVSETVAAAIPLRRRARSSRRDVPEVPAAPQRLEFLDEELVLAPGSEESEPEIVDEFAHAARVFSFTGETPVQAPRPADVHEAPQVRVRATPSVRQRRGKLALKRAAAASFSVSVVGVVGLLAVGTTTPVMAVGAFGQDVRGDISVVAAGTDADEPEIQAYVAASTVKASDLERSDQYDIESMQDVAASSGVTQFAGTWVNDETADIQWPFPVGVPISAHFGSSSYLSKFARAHQGTDFTPGSGAEIHAIAGGTVRIATEAGGDYGVTVVLDHIIDGQLVSTRYGHMQYGSLRVSPGQTVEPGQVIGQVGSTGKSTGAHLHLEVLLGGTTKIDPVPWLQQHTAD